MIKLEILILFLAIVQLSIYSQEFSTTIYFEDAVGNRDSIIVGYDANATDGLDAGFGEEDLTGLPFDSVFDVRILPHKMWASDTFDFNTKKQIQKKDCESESFYPNISKLIIKCKNYPIKLMFDSAKFNNDCLSNSLVTNWYPGGWFDAGFGQGPYYFKNSSQITFMKPSDEFQDNDSLKYIYLALANQFMLTDIETLNKSCVTVFPNPCTDYIRVAGKENVKLIEILNYNGVLCSTFTKNVDIISTNHLPTGFFFVRIILENEETIVKKIIKLQ